jgi:hypothetical protein
METNAVIERCVKQQEIISTFALLYFGLKYVFLSVIVYFILKKIRIQLLQKYSY